MVEPRACPYCLYRFPESPKRDTPCPACGEQVWVLLDRETGGRLLLTREQAEELRAEDARLRLAAQAAPDAPAPGSDERVRRWLRELEESHGVLPEDLERERTSAPACSDEELLWRLLKRLVELKRDCAELADLHARRARFLDEQGRDFAAELRQARALELLAIKRAGTARRVCIRGGNCAAGAALDGTALDLEHALHALPLPRPDCRRSPGASGRPLCNCHYVAQE
jgi:hypothetical protein